VNDPAEYCITKVMAIYNMQRIMSAVRDMDLIQNLLFEFFMTFLLPGLKHLYGFIVVKIGGVRAGINDRCHLLHKN